MVSTNRFSAGSSNAVHEIVLRRFAYLQHVRTEAVAQTSAEFVMRLATLKGSDLPIPSFKEAVLGGVLAAMRHYAEAMRLMDDLKLRLVRNRTTIPFFTSDNPAVLTNRWHQQDRRAGDLGFGSASAGAMMLLPLTPSILAILYDGDVYTAPHDRGWINVDSADDVDALNLHQVLNCAANLYFHDWDQRPQVAECCKAHIHLRPSRRWEATLAIPDRREGDYQRYVVAEDPDLQAHGEVLIHQRAVRPRPSAWPSFLRVRRGGRAYSNGTRAGYRRQSTAVPASLDSPPWRKVRI